MRLRFAVPMMLLLLLCACGAESNSAQTPIRVRTAITEAGGCGFTTAITADFGEYTRDFTLSCTGTAEGETQIRVLEPEPARDVTASVSGTDAKVSFGDTVLAVEKFDSRPISPLAAPGLLIQAWSQGYIDSVGRDGDWEQVHYLLGYGGNQLEIITCFSGQIPVQAEISDGNRVLITCEIRDFALGEPDN